MGEDGPTLERGWTPSGGERIYWELIRRGPADTRPLVVLSHGAGGSHAVWYQQVPALSARYRVLAWDSRGFGNSTNVAAVPSAEAAAADLTAVLDALDLADGHLIGQSMGGWHNAAFADAHPDRVRSLVFADTVGGMWTDELRAAFADFRARQTLGREGPAELGTHPALWSGTAARDPAHAFLYQALGTFFDPPTDQLGATIGWTIGHDRVAALGVPVLFVAGAHDDLFPADLLAASAALVPGAHFVEIAAAGHSPYFEQPDAWNDVVLRFLRTGAP